MAARYDISVKVNREQVELHRACRMTQAMEIAQAAVLRLKNNASADILRKRGKPPWLVMRYWFDGCLQYLRY